MTGHDVNERDMLAVPRNTEKSREGKKKTTRKNRREKENGERWGKKNVVLAHPGLAQKVESIGLGSVVEYINVLRNKKLDRGEDEYNSSWRRSHF